jgi:hypothetical protein
MRRGRLNFFLPDKPLAHCGRYHDRNTPDQALHQRRSFASISAGSVCSRLSGGTTVRAGHIDCWDGPMEPDRQLVPEPIARPKHRRRDPANANATGAWVSSASITPWRPAPP